MLKIKRIDHIAVCVADIDAAAERWTKVFGLQPGEREVVESQKTEAMLLHVGRMPPSGGGSGRHETVPGASVELISPRGNEGLERFLEKRGPGLHHVAIEVEGIEDAISLLESLGVPMIDRTPRKGARGHKVAFVHPKATGGVLVELVDSSGD